LKIILTSPRSSNLPTPAAASSVFNNTMMLTRAQVDEARCAIASAVELLPGLTRGGFGAHADGPDLSLHGVAIAIAWFRRTDRVGGRRRLWWSAYVLKHEIQSDCRCYVAQGDCAAAAAVLGLKVRRRGTRCLIRLAAVRTGEPSRCAA
jgi:hypothetical protein